jgi:hypothetical protein
LGKAGIRKTSFCAAARQKQGVFGWALFVEQDCENKQRQLIHNQLLNKYNGFSSTAFAISG